MPLATFLETRTRPTFCLTSIPKGLDLVFVIDGLIESKVKASDQINNTSGTEIEEWDPRRETVSRFTII